MIYFLILVFIQDKYIRATQVTFLSGFCTILEQY